MIRQQQAAAAIGRSPLFLFFFLRINVKAGDDEGGEGVEGGPQDGGLEGLAAVEIVLEMPQVTEVVAEVGELQVFGDGRRFGGQQIYGA